MNNSIGQLLAKRAHLDPRLEAVVELERGRRFTYAQLDARANRVASALLDKGVRNGDRVALLMMNGVESIESYFGAAKIGAVLVPLNWRLAPPEFAFILSDSGCRTLLFDAEFDPVVAALRGLTTPVEHWIRVGEGGPDFADDYDALCAAAAPTPPPGEAHGDDLLFIMYTSGTTGTPKGAVHTHETMMWASLTINLTTDMRHGDRYLQVMPLFHVGALTPATSMLHRGGTLIVMRTFDPARVFEVIERERISLGLVVPAMLQFMWGQPSRTTHDLSSLRWLMSGASALPGSMLEQYASMGIGLYQVYGLTETCGPACLISPERAAERPGSTGLAFFHTEVRVVDEAGQDVAPGEVGEVWIRGAHVMKGYWNQPEATAEVLRDGWLLSGDLARVDEDGFVYICDRKKDMILSGGENIYPAEVEHVLITHPAIAEAAVIGQPSSKWGESPLAIVVLAPGEALGEGDVIAHCRGRLAAYKVPRRVAFTDALPRNPSGKVLKKDLRRAYPGPAPE